MKRSRPREPAQRSRRLRKKLHIGEFREFGFHVRFALKASTDPLADLRFWDAFLAEAIETHDLTYGGGCVGFVCAGRGSATEAHRARIGEWLRAREDVGAVDIGPLVDAWYDSVDDEE